MPFTHSVVGIRPPARYDDALWTTAALLESATADGVYTEIEAFVLAAYADPTDPPAFSFTTSDATLETAYLRVEFRDAEGGIIRSAPLLSPDPSGVGYPATADLVAASSNEALLALSTAQQDALRLSAIAAIEDWTGQDFLAEDATTREVRSHGGAELFLPKRLRSLDSITYGDAGELELDAIYLGSDNDRLIFRSGVVGIGYYEQALYEVSGGDYPKQFPIDLLNITGDWGWEDVPDAIIEAIRVDMEEQATADASALSPSVAAFRKMGLTNISQGNLRADLSPAVPTLSPRVQRLLSPYVFLGQGGRMV
jgi:hypothetical protein